MTLELSAKEAEMLRNLLNRFIEETRDEVHHTDTESFKNQLKEQEQLAKQLLEKMKA